MERGQVQLGNYLKGVVEGLQQVEPNADLRLDVPAEPIWLDLDRTVHTGLLVHELITHAARHAFPPGQHGRVNVSVCPVADQLEIAVRDSGKGVPSGLDLERATTLGFRILRILARRLRATVRLENRGGASFTFTFPLQAEAPREPAQA